MATALFGHFRGGGRSGALSDAERAERAERVAGIARYKRHRALIHAGDLVRLDRAAGEIAFGIVAADREEGLFSYTQVTEPQGYFTDPIRIAGLDAVADYRVRLAWALQGMKASPLFAALRDGVTASGRSLMTTGLRPPRLAPQSGFVLHVERARRADGLDRRRATGRPRP